jgi:hypothetical protein
MTSFDRREEAFEAKFALDEERAFKARARALRILGLWAAEKRGEERAAAEEYVRALIEADINGAPDAAFNKLVLDLTGHAVGAAEIREKLDALLASEQNSLT